MAEQDSSVPADPPEQPVLDEVERRKRELRKQITIRAGQIIDLKFSGRMDEAATVEAEVARMRRELAGLSPTDVWTRPGTAAGS